MSKRWQDLTDQELREEYAKWSREIENATSWGAAYSLARSFQRAASDELKRRDQ